MPTSKSVQICGWFRLGDPHRLALEALETFRVVRKMLGQHLDRDRAMESRIDRAIDFAHAANRDQRLDFVRTEQAPGKATESSAPRQTPGRPADSRKSFGSRLIVEE